MTHSPPTVRVLYFTRQEVADLLRCSLRTVDRWIDDDLLDVEYVGRRVLVTRDSLLRFRPGLAAVDLDAAIGFRPRIDDDDDLDAAG